MDTPQKEIKIQPTHSFRSGDINIEKPFAESEDTLAETNSEEGCVNTKLARIDRSDSEEEAADEESTILSFISDTSWPDFDIPGILYKIAEFLLFF